MQSPPMTPYLYFIVTAAAAATAAIAATPILYHHFSAGIVRGRYIGYTMDTRESKLSCTPLSVVVRGNGTMSLRLQCDRIYNNPPPPHERGLP